ncbi:MAG: sugar transferase, partial [Anaerolineaceae bacterium]|nr:sugar transferase [Anaerolineaceae bacterium]
MTESEYQVSIPVRDVGASSRIRTLVDAFLRRGLDIFASLFGLIFLAPLFLVIAIKIRRDTPGPVFYHGRRAARGGGEFSILKFRTMHECAESYQGASVTAQDDNRITPYGRWLRDHKVNELPQLWNVLIGDMSLVGPRPEDPEIVAKEWPPEVQAEILSVRPGVTSPSSVLYRDEEKLLNSDDVMQDYLRDILPSKMRLDLLHVRNRSFITDLDVIFYTFIVLFPSLRKINISEDQLYWGALSRFATRNLFWFVLDSIIAAIGITLAGIIWRTEAPLNIGWTNASFFAVGTALIFGMSNAIFGISRISWSKASAADVFLLSISSVMSTAVLILVHEFILPLH